MGYISLSLDYDSLLADMLAKVEEVGTNQKVESEKMGLAPIIFRNIRNYNSIYLDTYLKIVQWLGKEVNEYLK